MIQRIPRCSHRAYHTGKVGDVAPQPSGRGAELLFTYLRPSACAACEAEYGACYDPSPTVAASIDVDLAFTQVPGFDPSLMDASAAFLRVEYGSGTAGVKHTVDVDLVNGTSLPLIAESANFYIIYPAATFNPDLPSYQPTLRIAVSVGEFNFGSTGTRAPQRTVLVGALVEHISMRRRPGPAVVAPTPEIDDDPSPVTVPKRAQSSSDSWVSALVPIPKYAIAMSLQTADDLDTVRIDQYTNPTGAPHVLMATNTLVKPEYDSVRVAQGARGVVVTAGQDSARVAVLFYLGPA